MKISLVQGYKFVRSGFGIGIAVEEDIRNELLRKQLYILNVTRKMPIKDSITLKDSALSFSTEKFIQLLQEKESN